MVQSYLLMHKKDNSRIHHNERFREFGHKCLEEMRKGNCDIYSCHTNSLCQFLCRFSGQGISGYYIAAEIYRKYFSITITYTSFLSDFYTPYIEIMEACHIAVWHHRMHEEF